MCNAGLSPMSRRLKEASTRVRRVVPLTTASVFALLSCAGNGELRVVPRKDCLSSRFVG